MQVGCLSSPLTHTATARDTLERGQGWGLGGIGPEGGRGGGADTRAGGRIGQMWNRHFSLQPRLPHGLPSVISSQASTPKAQ